MLYRLCFTISAVLLGLSVCLSVGLYALSGDGTYLRKTLKVGCGIVTGVVAGVLLLSALSQGV